MGMLNYETLLSSYDDKLTLMQWLKKVEAALKNASATSFVLNKKGNATISFSIVFEDGTSLESGDIVLQQGESVQSAYIQNGNLHLVLTNGDDLDAGNMFNGNVTINGSISVADGAVSTPILTSQNTYIEAQKPVVEVMTGYSFVPIGTPTNTTREFLYAGAAKNGNKLTFVIALNLENNTGVQDGVINVGRFYIPSSVLNKLIPSQIGSFNLLYIDNIKLFQNLGITPLYVTTYVEKGSSYISVDLRKVDDLVQNVKYYCRIELTFLLSENLAA